MAKASIATTIIRTSASPDCCFFNDKRKDGWRRYKVLDEVMTHHIALSIQDELRKAGYCVEIERYIGSAYTLRIDGWVFWVKPAGELTVDEASVLAEVQSRRMAADTERKARQQAEADEKDRQRRMIPYDIAGYKYSMFDVVAFIHKGCVELGQVAELKDGKVFIDVDQPNFKEKRMELKNPEKMRIQR